MKANRGKKGKYVVYAEKGLVKPRVWRQTLKNYRTDLVRLIRKKLKAEIPGLNEKFNTNSRYFGYRIGTDADRVYIYVQKNVLRIDLHISRNSKTALQEEDFEVRFSNNFQGKAGWLTGWRVPHTTENVEAVMKWLLKALNKDR